VLDSRPSGADVWDGDDVIGTTPMQVTIDRAGAKGGPRRFVLRLEGLRRTRFYRETRRASCK